ncbi:transcriptional regulator ATRX [Tribolium madens]|uniref:transcriptional regulator ATRX n=1 Tax=Tribolium madens TaxID=41895 RepID=UPI001CF73076|nr:transcriptional regulator ATRX [Tribolium madens]
MDAANTFEEKGNNACGCLMLNNRIYPVFEGLNTIGRNPEAVINIKNSNVSKQHAIITIIDADTHFISDLKSVNGTFLDSTKLSHLKLYSLKNGASIKFGDVFCTYKKLDSHEHITNNHDETQDFSEPFYSSNTQQVEVPTLPEGINFNEMPTQIFEERAIGINELPTQIHNFDEVGDDSNDSIDFITMQKTTESQTLANSPPEPSTQVTLNSGRSVESDDAPAICPVRKGTRNIIESDSQSSSQVKQNSDLSAGSDDESVICPVRKKASNVIESDSDTEEYEPNQNKSKYVLSDDSETEIEDNATDNVENLNKKIKDDSVMDSLVLSVDESVEKNTEKKEESTVQSSSENKEKDFKVNEKILDQETRTGEQMKNQTLQNEFEENKQDVEYLVLVKKDAVEESINEKHFSKLMEIEEITELPIDKGGCAATKDKDSEATVSDLGEESEDLKLKLNSGEEGSSKEQEKRQNEEVIDEFVQSIPQNNFDFVEEKSKIVDVNDQETEDLYIQPTQQMEANTVSDQMVSTGVEDDELYLQPTQTLELLEQMDENPDLEEQIEHSISNLETSPICKNTEAQDPPPNALESLPNDNKRSNLLEKSSTSTNLKDDIFLPPTQALESLHGGEASEQPKDVFAIPKQKDDDAFLPPTQALESMLSEGLSSKKQTTETLGNKLVVGGDYSFIIQPTQALEEIHSDPNNLHFNKVEDQLAEIFASQSIMATQQLVSVLETTHEDIIDDSMYEEPDKLVRRSVFSMSFKQSKPLSDEAVKEILGEGMEKETQEIQNVHNENVKTYTRNKFLIGKEPIEKKMLEEATSGFDTESISSSSQASQSKEDNSGKSGKGGKSKQDLSIKDDEAEECRNKEKINFDKDSIMTRSGRRKQALNTPDADEAKNNEQDNIENKADVSLTEPGIVDAKKAKEDDHTKNILKQNNSAFSNSTNDVVKESKKKGRPKKKDDLSNEKLTLVEAKGDDKEDVIGITPKGRKRKGGREQCNESQSSNSDEQKTITRKRKNEETLTSTETSNKLRKKVTTNTAEGRESPLNKNLKVQPATSTPRKRVRRGTHDSEDAFETKIPKCEESAIKKLPATSRMNTRRGKVEKDEDVVSISSTSSNQEQTVDNKRHKSDESIKKEKAESSKMTTRSGRLGKEDDVVSISSSSSNRGQAVDVKSPKFDESATKKTSKLSKMTTRGVKIKKEDDVMSISSTSSSQDQTVKEPTKRGRRLSANSRRLKREEEEQEKKNKTITKQNLIETSSPTTSGSPQRSKRQLKPKVVFTMMDNPELESLIRHLGGSIVETVDACTVLVTENVKRSQKLLCAVAQSKPICSPQWLHACKKASVFVDPWDYILEDKEAEKKWKFSLRESLNRSSKKKLLENHSFQLIVNNAADVLKGAIEACGGKCLRSLAKADSDNLYIVSCEENKSKCNKIVKQNPKIKIVTAEAIFDGTLRQEFKFNDHVLM